MTYACPVCGNDLAEYGTGGMTCSLGHQFMARDVRAGTASFRVASRTVRPWVPGAVLGGLALLIELVGVVI